MEHLNTFLVPGLAWWRPAVGVTVDGSRTLDGEDEELGPLADDRRNPTRHSYKSDTHTPYIHTAVFDGACVNPPPQEVHKGM